RRVFALLGPLFGPWLGNARALGRHGLDRRGSTALGRHAIVSCRRGALPTGSRAHALLFALHKTQQNGVWPIDGQARIGMDEDGLHRPLCRAVPSARNRSSIAADALKFALNEPRKATAVAG